MTSSNAAQGWGVSRAEAVSPLVLSLDIGSTASRGALYDAHARPVSPRAKVRHSFTTGRDGAREIDADQVTHEVGQIIDRLVRPGGPADGHVIGAVALDTFAPSMVLADSAGKALTRAMTYADSRPHAQVADLRGRIDESELHQRVGARLHSSYWPARLLWLRAEHPGALGSAAHVLSLGDYVLLRLIGVLATGTSSAAWTGMVDLSTADWSQEVLDLAGIDRSKVPPLHDPDQPLALDTAASRAVARRWPALTQATWFAPVADGLAANLGLGASDERTIGGTAATSGALRVLVRDLPPRLPDGLWCYRVSREQALMGGALNDVGRALTWATSSLALAGDAPGGDTGVGSDAAGQAGAAAVLGEALAREPDTRTPLVLPFFTGERSTGWAANARAVFTGMSEQASAATTARGVVEGIAISYRRILAQLHEVAPDAAALHLGGSVTSELPQMAQVLADVLGLPLTPVTIKRSTLLGNALLALAIVAPGTERLGPSPAPTLVPSPAHAAYYADRAARFEQVYRALFG